jgi:hypothetical protein
MITIYETRYYGATDNYGARIRVKNLRTGDVKSWHWDYSLNGGHDQHQQAVRDCAAGEVLSVEYGGETRHSYYWTVTR